MTTVPYLERDVMVDGLKLHYQEWGDRSKPPVIMLHGFGVSGHMFDEFAARLQDRYFLIAIDQRGHGDSEWSEKGDYSRDAFVDDLEGFRAALGIESFILVGHSMGGLNSVAYTVKHQDRVKALVLVDVGPEAAKEGVDNIIRFTRGPDELEFEEFVRMAHQFNQRRTIENIRERMSHRLRQLPSGKWTWKFDARFRKPDSGLTIGSEMTNDQAWQLFRDVKAPTLLVRGGESDVLKAETAERCIREMNRARLVTVPGAGHSVPGDRPDEFTEAVSAFLDDVAARKFEPYIEADPPPLAELVTEQDRAGRNRPGAFTLVLIGVGAAAAIGGIALAGQQASSRRRRSSRRRERQESEAAAPGVETIDDEELDRAVEEALEKAEEALEAAQALESAAGTKQRRRRRATSTARFGWRVLSFAPRRLLASGRSK